MELSVQGERVPALGLGTWQVTGEQCARGARHALEIGYRHLDTAAAYGNEEEVGRGMRESGVPREDVFLVTKVGPRDLARDRLLRSARESMRRLGTDLIDLLLAHWPNPDVPLKETMSAMLELQRGGSVRFVGVSNFSTALVEEAQRYGPVFSNQVEYSPYHHDDELLAHARESGYLLTAYSPVGRGRVERDPVLRNIGERHSKTPAQVALRWVVQQGAAAIPKAASEEHRAANLEVFDFEVTDEELRTVGGLAR